MMQFKPNGFLVKMEKNDLLPEWFHGLISRRETEELLKSQETGHFLIRLCQRTFCYILSYKGKERCRHFVINQLQNGKIVVSGDSKSHDSLTALVSHYQTSPIYPFGEKLTKSYIKFSDNKYDKIEPGCQSLERQKEMMNKTCAEGAAPPLPERNLSVMHSLEKNDTSLGMTEKTNQRQDKNEIIYSKITKTDATHSLTKEAKVAQKGTVKSKMPSVLYYEVKLNKNVSTGLQHVQSISQSRATSQEAVKMRVDRHSEYEVMQLNVATSFQCTNRVQMLNSNILEAPMMKERVENQCSYKTGPDPELENPYEELPLSGLKSTAKFHDYNQLSSFSESCKTLSYRQLSHRASKDIFTENVYEAIPIPTPLQNNTLVSEQADRKQTTPQKNEKQKRLFSVEKKK